MKIVKSQRHEFDAAELGIELVNIDVVLTTREITQVIEQLKELKEEGRKKRGYHFHLIDDSLWSPKAGDRVYQVTFEHQKNHHDILE